jgi:hypothetical protein
VAPLRLLSVLDRSVAEYRLYMLNAPRGIPDRDGVTYETSFIGAGMRDHPRLAYFPSRLSLVPTLLRDRLIPDVVLLHSTVPSSGSVSLGVEVNIMPAAIEAAQSRGGIVIAQANRQMPTTFGDATLPLDVIDYLVEVDQPLMASGSGRADPISSAIGERVAAVVPDRARFLTRPYWRWPTAVDCGCGRRCSATVCSPWRRPGAWTGTRP